MLDTTMYVQPKDTKKMSPEEIAHHAVHWVRGTVEELVYIAVQTIPHGYVQIRRDPESGEEWLHYGTRWLNADVTDTKVKLAPRIERLEQEKEDLADIENQLKELELLHKSQKERINALDIQVQSNA